ncbi:MAG TPA: hypothetical protein VJJ83_00475, partial [Candidatus Babeliales bacterium]|nr:hypothetical protein [Candidatus Babeliales bacterium]
MSKQTEFPKTTVLGLELDLANSESAVAALVDFGLHASQAGYLVRPHVEFIEQAQRDPKLMQLLNQAQFCLADGVALQWAAAYLQSPGKSWWHLLHSLSQIPRNSASLRGVIKER